VQEAHFETATPDMVIFIPICNRPDFQTGR